MQKDELIDTIRSKYQRVSTVLDERARRVWAAVEAEAIGYGGQSIVAKATGLSRVTLHRGGLEQRDGLLATRIRRVGGGRPKRIDQERKWLSALEALVEPTTRGDPESALRWTCQSTRQLARTLAAQGHRISHQTVASLLDELGYSLQGNQKTKEGGRHPDRDAQFQYIHARVGDFQRRGQPVVSVDTKKKELVGDFKNSGQTWRPRGTPEPVRVYDFVDKTLGKVNPYGVYAAILSMAGQGTTGSRFRPRSHKGLMKNGHTENCWSLRSDRQCRVGQCRDRS